MEKIYMNTASSKTNEPHKFDISLNKFRQISDSSKLLFVTPGKMQGSSAKTIKLILYQYLILILKYVLFNMM